MGWWTEVFLGLFVLLLVADVATAALGSYQSTVVMLGFIACLLMIE